MNRRIVGVFVVLLTATVLAGVGAAPAYAKSYSMPSVAINAYVEPTGDVRVVETRTFDFSGDFSWVQWKMSMAGSTGIEILSVTGPTGEYRWVQDEGQGKGTYTFWDDGSSVFLKLFHSTSDAQATFVIEYRAFGAAKRYTDTAELYWQFIGDESEVGVGSASIDIFLPVEYGKDQVQVWAHGPLNGTVYAQDGGIVQVRVDRLPSYTFVEPRVLFPADGIAQAPLIDSPRKAEAIAQEARWAEEANAERTKARREMAVSYSVGLGLPLLALLGSFVLWLRYGKERKPQYPGGYYRELPADLAPAVVGALWRFGVTTDADTVATLMDLSNRGVITVAPEAKTERGLFGEKTETTYRLTLDSSTWDSLARFEQELLSFMFTTVAKGDSLTIDELKDAAESDPQEFVSGMGTWRNSVHAEADRMGFFETTGGALRWVLVAASFVLGIIAFFASGAAESWWPFAVGVPSAIGVATFGAYMPRRAPAANELYWKYRGLRDYLRDFSRLNEAPPTHIVLWEHFLVMAVVFGIAEQVIEAMRVRIPQVLDDPALGHTRWWVTPGQGYASPASALSSGFASAASTASSKMSSSSGGGGGFSGGGGGGGGGGGVSAG